MDTERQEIRVLLSGVTGYLGSQTLRTYFERLATADPGASTASVYRRSG